MIGARMVIACVVAAAFVSPARAQGFPNKTMRLIVPFTPGGSNVRAAQVKQMNGGHKRNTGPMLSSLRCGAKIRSGRPCKSPSVLGKKRCRMHGGALQSGAPRGNKNALKHGRFTHEAIAERGHIRELIGRRATCSCRSRAPGRAELRAGAAHRNSWRGPSHRSP